MLLVNLLQRGIGFARNIALCYFLSEAQLGLWGLTSSFFCLAAPFAVLGLPGTFGRFVETYRSRGHLLRFLALSMTIAMVGYLAIGLTLISFSGASSMAILGEPHSGMDMGIVALALGCIILFNAMTELVSGLRLPKLVSWMHAINSLSFTCLSLFGLAWYRDWRVLVIAFACSAMLGMIPTLPMLLRSDYWRRTDQPAIAWSAIARRVLPFAASVWAMNLLWNCFDIVDRYALLHLSPMAVNGQDIHALIGQLHSGKLIPTLLSNLGVMLAGIVLPYLVADWEQDRRDRVHESLKTTVKFGSLFFLMMSVGALVASPFLFGVILQDRYAGGLSILPEALTVCCWMSISLFLSNYFWCAERGRLLGFLTAAALMVDMVLCIAWIPKSGLHGAILANVFASGFLLAVTMFTLDRLQVKLDRATYAIAATPVALVLGTVPATMVFTAIILIASRTNWILTDGEKASVDSTVVPHLHRAGWLVSSIWAR
jgi:PST family polysaccharide transporter